jgi:copper chaperone NosL
MRHAALLLVLALTAACRGPASPASLEPGRDVCAHCRQVVRDPLFAAQIVAPGESPLFFDDIGCLFDYLSRHTRLRPGAIAYVADHQNGEWVVAATALYTRNLQVPTPMNSHLIAHGSVNTQVADPAGRTGLRVTLQELSPLDVPDGMR